MNQPRPRPLRPLLLASALCALLLPVSLQAATITVDGVTCALGDAIVAANTDAAVGGCPAGDAGLDTIVLDADVTLSAVDVRSTDVDGGAGGLPDVIDDLTITAGAADLIQRDPALDCDVMTADPTFRYFSHTGGALTIENVRFENGCFVGDLSAIGTNEGGGIRSASGATSITLSGVTVRNHAALTTDNSLRGGFVEIDGHPATVVDSVFEDIVAESAGSLQGGILSGDTLTFERTIVRRVDANAGGSLQGAAIYLSTSDPAVIRDDVAFEDFTTGSSSSLQGGAIYSSSSVDVTLDDVTFRRFVGISTNSSGQGGALYLSTSGVRTLRSVTFTDLQLTSMGTCSGGAIYASGGGSQNSMTVEGLVIDDASCSSMTSAGRGGGFYATTNGFALLRDCVVRNSRVAHITSGLGGGLYISSNVIDRIERCSFVDNVVEPFDATASGRASGGGIHIQFTDEPIALRNVTVAGNTVVGSDGVALGAAGGDAAGGGIGVSNDDPTPLALTHVTVADNVVIAGAGADGVGDGVGEGGGLHLDDPNNVVTLDNTILADNVVVAADGAMTDEDCLVRGMLGSDGFNLVENPTDGCTFASPGDIVGLDPRLRMLGDYGCAAPLPDGACVPTIAIDQTSWAVDGGSCADANLAVDARNFLRRQDVAGVANSVDGCDVGAYEAFDTDGDGITDAVDPCPNEPGDACALFGDGFETATTGMWSAIETGG
ncbi:MAG: right-handed parallel beta-helix repeat-containing protein [Acidobacteriota bacterium]